MINRYFISGEIAVIEMYHSKIHRYFYTIVDKEDLKLILENVVGINLIPEYYTFYAKCNLGKGKQVPLHRLIMKTPKELQVDHINNNGLDNRKKNLRNCTAKVNQANRRKRIPFKFDYIGGLFKERFILK